MSIGWVFDSGLAGYRSAIDRLTGAASRVAHGPIEGDLPTDLVTMKSEQIAASASLKVIRTADELLGSILDTVR